MFKSQRGFTLIESMIVVGIIGVLSALVIPAYQNFLVRAQVTDGLNLAGSWQAAVVEYYSSTGAWPSQSDLTTVPSGGLYASNVTVNAGVIQITYGGPQAHPAISGAVLTLVPYTTDSNAVLWQCGLAAAPAGMIASGAAPGGTTLTAQQLPASCRS